MKRLLYIIALLFFTVGFSQEESDRIGQIESQLVSLSGQVPGLTEDYSATIDVSTITLPNFFRAVAEIHELNINVDISLNTIMVVNNFQKVSVVDLLVFLCKEYQLTVDFTGDILSFKPYRAPEVIKEPRIIPVSFNPNDDTISIDAKNDNLYEVFKRIIDASGKNLVFAPGLDNMQITSYIQEVPFDVAMYKLALANNLYTEQTEDGFWIFENALKDGEPEDNVKRLLGQGSTSFTVINKEKKLLDVDFQDKSIADIIYAIGEVLEVDIFTATPLEKAGTVTLNAKAISFDELLVKIFEMQRLDAVQNTNPETNQNSRNRDAVKPQGRSLVFSFKKEANRYFFGTDSQLSIKTIQVVHLQHRSIELLSNPMGGDVNTTSSRVLSNLKNTSGLRNSYNSSYNQNNNRQPTNNQVNNPQETLDRESLLKVLPEDITNNLDIKIDYELNSFYVNGSAPKVERFKKFIKEIDKPVPVVLIEVMILETKKSATIETGVDWGIGTEPTITSGMLFPETDVTLGAKTINRIIGSFNSFSGFNLGKVGPNFIATIKAMESNGDLKITSTPRLATLNSHRASFTNGQTSFYAVTERNIYGTTNPQTSEITNYLPIDAELGLTIKPSVSGDGQVLLDISVIQSSFGTRVADDAPPDVISRNFSSIIRMQDQDVAILGGLEEQMKNKSGSGVPFLARVPLVKFLFSKRKRTASKSKLTILIKPTIIK